MCTVNSRSVTEIKEIINHFSISPIMIVQNICHFEVDKFVKVVFE